MVVPSEKTQRPAWTKSGSWRMYIRRSDRKLQDDSERTGQQKHVHFSDDINTQIILMEPVSEGGEELLWYMQSDYECFERDRQLTALQYRTLTKKGTPFIEREHSVRGLEGLLCAEEEIAQKNILSGCQDTQKHVGFVLEEQTRQRAAGCYPNPFMFREISCKSSREARNRSAALGEADALAGHPKVCPPLCAPVH